MKRITYIPLAYNCRLYWMLLAGFAILTLNGLYFAWFMEHHGHWVTGMNNQIVWGLPHVFAIFLIVTASGVLNIASLSSVFGKPAYKVWARLSGLLAITLLAGGLMVLVLDLGRPDRLIIAMTHYNFKSIFAWNIFLYTGFVLVVVVYLWMMFEPKMAHKVNPVGRVAFVWRIILTTGTGSIFGVIIARQAYDTVILAPLFIAMSLSLGAAFFVTYLFALRQPVFTGDSDLLLKLRKLLIIFICSVLLITMIFHITKAWDTATREYERFILLDGGLLTALFWAGSIVLGMLAPLLLLSGTGGAASSRILSACVLHILGGLVHLYVIIIGGQAYPSVLFQNKEISSSFYDGAIAGYCPSFAELSLGLGGMSLAIAASLLVIRVLPFLPENSPSHD